MTVETLRALLGWCSLINIAIMIFWFLMLVSARDWAYRLHEKFFRISRETFTAVQYAGGLFYKLIVFVFFVIPYLALRIVS